MQSNYAKTFSILFTSATFYTTSVIAQETVTILDRIVVDGERIERTVFETPSSVVAIPGEDLEDTPAIQNVEDILEDIPNIIVFGSSNQAPNIRGQQTGGPLSGAGSFLSGVLPRATLTVDGRALSANEYVFGTTSLWDLETVEVFRGPQTTSQGPNSIAGAIYLQTKDPTFESEAAIRGQASSFNGYQGSALVNVPLVDNELALRATIDYRTRDTYIDYATPGQNLISENFSIDQLTGRVKLLWQPSEQPGLTSKLTFTHNDTSSPQTELVDQPFQNLTRTSNTDPSAFTTGSTSLIHDFTYDFSDNFTFKNQFYWSGFEAQRLAADPTTGFADIDGDDFTNETLLNLSLMEGQLNGVVGLYLRSIDEDSVFLFGDSTSTINDQKTSIGIFTEWTYDVTDRLDVTAGVRYQRDRQERTGVAFNGSLFFTAVPLNFDETFDSVLPKFSIGYDVNDNLRIGAIASRGFNPGGTNLSFNTFFTGSPTPFFNFDEETLWNYELFARARLLDERLFLQANVFYTDFNDAQRVTTTLLPNGIPDSVVQNAEDARSYGAEISLDYRASDTFRFYGSVGFLDTEFEQFTSSTAAIVGNEFRQAPSFTGTVGFDWEFYESLTFGAKARFTDGYFSDDANTLATEVNEHTIVDLKLDYEPNENFKIFGFVNNVFDEIEAVDIFPSGPGLVATTTVPREYGGGVSIKF